MTTRKDDRVTREWMRDASDDLAVRNGCWFDPLVGGYTVWWIERYCRLYEGEQAGEPLRLRGLRDEPEWGIHDEWDGDAEQAAIERHAFYCDGAKRGRPRDWQYEFHMRLYGWRRHSEHLGFPIRRFRRADVWIPKKNKKAMSLDTPVPTPGGWTTVGDIQVGDAVFDVDGSPCTVVAKTEVFTGRKCYAVEFSNGERVTCDAGHLWVTSSLIDETSERTRPFRVRTTQEIADTLLRRDGARVHSLLVGGSLQLPDCELPIDPYIFGTWLGDGDKDAARFTSSVDDVPHWESQFAATATTLRPPVAKPGSRACRLAIGERFSSFRTTLRSMGVLNNKHIPAEYLRASHEQRLSLLQGLMDTDGCCSRDGKGLIFATSRREIMEGFGELLSSLGVKFSVRRIEASASWRFQFHAFRDVLPAFRMGRKLDRMRSSSGNQMAARSRTLQIVAVTEVESVPVQCVTVSSPTGQLLVGRTMVPTHNSPTLAANGLYLTCGDSEKGQHVAVCAKDGMQARKIAGTHLLAMVSLSPELRRECKVNLNECSITHVRTRSDIMPFSSSNARTKESKEGFNGSLLVDETHVVDRDFMRRTKRSGISRTEPLLLHFSTAGNNPDGYGKECFDYGLEVSQGKAEDDQLLFCGYFAPQETQPADLHDRDEVIRIGQAANPAWGHTIQQEEFVADWQQSKRTVGETLDFAMYRLNVWQKSVNPWLAPGAWAACSESYTLADLRGEQCIVGFDKSRNRDFSAFVGLFPEWGESGLQRYRLWPWIVAPKQYVEANQYAAPFRDWIHRGQLLVSPGDVIDIGYLFTLFGKIAADHEVLALAYDPNRAEEITQLIEQGASGKSGERLSEGYGVRRVPVGTSSAVMSQAIDDFHADVTEGRVVHPGHAVLDWMIGNTQAVERGDRTKLEKPSKGDTKKIDGVIAAVVARAVAGNSEWRPAAADFAFEMVTA